jgi:protein TilB
VEDDSLLDEEADIPETGHLNEQGEMVRPWCPATRILEHREMVSGLALPGVSVQ